LIDENWIKMRLGITEHYPLIDEKWIKNRLGIGNRHSEVVVEVWIATSILDL
jgi:DNA-binding CsgD family transcriptional regulator